MSEDNKYVLDDLVTAAVVQKPLDFETAFNDLVVDRIRSAIENKKVEVAQQMYGYEPEIEYDAVEEPELETLEEPDGQEP